MAAAAASNTGVVNDQTHTAQSGSCGLLKLPAELRNNIYELVFTVASTATTDLLYATPPPKSLLSTCREIHDEAAAMYKDTYRRFWTSSSFVLVMDRASVAAAKVFIEAMRDEDLDHIVHLTTRYDIYGSNSSDADNPQAIEWNFTGNAAWTKRWVFVDRRGAPEGRLMVIYPGEPSSVRSVKINVRRAYKRRGSVSMKRQLGYILG